MVLVWIRKVHRRKIIHDFKLCWNFTCIQVNLIRSSSDYDYEEKVKSMAQEEQEKQNNHLARDLACSS
jgi:hypothetical protein